MNRSYYISIQQRTDGEDTTESRDVEIEVDYTHDGDNWVTSGIADVEQMIFDMEQESRTVEVYEENVGRLARVVGRFAMAQIDGGVALGKDLDRDDVEYNDAGTSARFVLNSPDGEVEFTLSLEEPMEVEI